MTVERLKLDSASIAAVVDVFCEAFHDYPVMRFVLGRDRPTYDADLRTLIGLFVNARVYRQEYLFGARDGEALAAAAIVSRPAGPPAPAEFFELRTKVWAGLGRAAEERYDAFGAACAPLQVEAPHLHLNMIGARRSAQGRGLGRMLLERVHALSQADPESAGVTLTTELESNLPFYERFGYRRVGTAQVGPGLTTWGFYRPNEPS